MSLPHQPRVVVVSLIVMLGAALAIAQSGSTLNVSSSTLVFPWQVWGTTSSAQILTVSNQGSSQITLASIAASGDFIQSNGCFQASGHLNPGDSCQVSVSFRPTGTGTRNGVLTIVSDAANSPTQVALSGSGTVIDIAPRGLVFRTQPLNTASAPSTITVKNRGSSTSTLTAVTITGEFSQTNVGQANACQAGQLAASSECSIVIVFTPTATGLRSGSLTISHQGGGSPQSVPLSGTGTSATATLNVSPTSLTFDWQLIGATSAAQAVTITTGSSAVNINGISVSGDYLQTNNCIPSGSTSAQLPPSSACTIAVSFKPRQTGTRTGTLTISDDAAGSPHNVALTGAGTVIEITPRPLSFPPQLLNSTSAPQQATIRNRGSTVSTITGISITGDYLEQSDTCKPSGANGQLQPSASCAVNVTFTPTALGTRTGTLTLFHMGGGSPQTISLVGTGNNAGPTANVSPTSLDFSSVTLNTTSSPQTVQVTNSGGAPLVFQNISTTGDFAATSNCSGQISVGASCSISVTFRPTQLGGRTGTLVIQDNAPDTPQIVQLSGTGTNQAAAITISPASLTFPSTAVGGASVGQNVTITNSGGASVVIYGIAVSGDYTQTNTCIAAGQVSGTIAPQSSCTVIVRFRPTAPWTRTGMMIVTHSAATSAQNVALSGTSTVSSTGAQYLVISPDSTCVSTQGLQQFLVAVSGFSNTAVSWSVDGVNGGNSTTGTIDSSGLYSPGAIATHTVKATSLANATKSATAVVNVISGISTWITPGSIAVRVSQNFPLESHVCGDASGQVTWKVDGIQGGNSTVGTIIPSGVYTAPAVPGTHTIQVASVADPTRTSTITASVYDSVTVDFGSRDQSTAVVPAELFGVQLGNLNDQTAMNTLAQGGFGTTRLYAKIPEVYATTTPNWTSIDPSIAKLRQAGLRPIVMMAFTPTWLQPSPNPCGTLPQEHSVPADMQRWAQLVASYVAHFDQAFPGFVQDYEIWNEPDLGSLFCVPISTTRLNAYMSLFAAAAPAMYAQASADSVSIRVGGPSLSNAIGLGDTWITSLVTDSRTAPHVSFVSYHQYLGGEPVIRAGMNWDEKSGTQPLYARTQDTTWGAAAAYKKVDSLVRRGSQPNAATTPIYLSEFDDNSGFLRDCCRNSPIYSPLWNGMMLADLLNGVYSGIAEPVSKIAYYAASTAPFCMLGTVNTSMDCTSSGGYSPYPQYYLYTLFASPTNLALTAGGHMARSISPTVRHAGLTLVGFYTASKNSIVLINTTPWAYPNLRVQLTNSGGGSGTGNFYRLDNTNVGQILTSPLSFAQVGSSFSAFVNVPPYSVVAVSLNIP